MKKIIFLLILLGGVVAGIYYWKYKPAAEGADPATLSTAKAEKGEILLSVSAIGRIVPNFEVEIKCKASGKILELPFDEGAFVQKDKQVVVLDQTDEKRLLAQALAEEKASKAKLDQAKTNLVLAMENLKIEKKKADASLKAVKSKERDIKSKAERLKVLWEQKRASDEDYETAKNNVVQIAMELTNAEIRMEELALQEKALQLKESDVILAQAQHESNEISVSSAQQRLSDTVVFAPMDGIVTSRKVQTGQIISSGISNVGGGTAIMALADMSQIFVLASIDESEVGKPLGVELEKQRVENKGNPDFYKERKKRKEGELDSQKSEQKGEKSEQKGEKSEQKGEKSEQEKAIAKAWENLEVNITVDSYPGKIFKGKVIRIAPKGNNVSNVVTFEAKIEVISHNKSLLLPEMTASVEIVMFKKPEALLVPTEAIFRKSGKLMVSVKDQNGKTTEKEVEVGIRDSSRYEILKGLEENEVVVLQKVEQDSQWRKRQPNMLMRGGGGGRRM